jgi:hypothetical protein
MQQSHSDVDWKLLAKNLEDKDALHEFKNSGQINYVNHSGQNLLIAYAQFAIKMGPRAV